MFRLRLKRQQGNKATRQQGNKATRQQTEASYLVASTLIEVVLS
jgi:hypothetical protein